MTLTVGTRLGPYTVNGHLGSGGMGEVYQATDTNLKREVALKVLPASVAADAVRLLRFQREAEVLAALNHPNIAQIYGLEKSGGIIALVMELVEGLTLEELIAGSRPSALGSGRAQRDSGPGQEPKAQSPKPKAQSPKPKAQSRKPKAESPEPAGFPSRMCSTSPARSPTRSKRRTSRGSSIAI